MGWSKGCLIGKRSSGLISVDITVKIVYITLRITDLPDFYQPELNSLTTFPGLLDEK
jgi:hypothetical protein